MQKVLLFGAALNLGDMKMGTFLEPTVPTVSHRGEKDVEGSPEDGKLMGAGKRWDGGVPSRSGWGDPWGGVWCTREGAGLAWACGWPACWADGGEGREHVAQLPVLCLEQERILSSLK